MRLRRLCVTKGRKSIENAVKVRAGLARRFYVNADRGQARCPSAGETRLSTLGGSTAMNGKKTGEPVALPPSILPKE